MAYVVVRIFTSSGMKKSADEVSQIAHRELVPKLTAAGGLIRFVTIGFSDGRYGSFSAYESQDAAKRGHQIAVEWVKVILTPKALVFRRLWKVTSFMRPKER